MAKVHVKFNAAVIKEVQLTKDETTFGRRPGNDIVIDHPTISGFHGKIRRDGDRYLVEDLNSTNGTFLNGARIKASAVKDGDQIGVAGHILEFFADGRANVPDPSAVPPAAAPAPAPSATPADGAGLEKQKEMLRRSLGIGASPSAGASAPSSAGAASDAPVESAPFPDAAGEPAAIKMPAGGPGIIRIVSGGVNGQTEVTLKDLVTYIGTSDQAAIKIKGFLAPSLAAAVSRRPEGYFLKAVKAGYPKVNSNPVQEQIFLENGALIEVGGTNMVFYHADAKKQAESQTQAAPKDPTDAK